MSKHVDRATDSSGAQMKPEAPALQTVDRALAILELFKSSHELGVRDIARRLGVSPTIVHRVLVTLTGRGFIEQDLDSRLYRLGPTLRDLVDSLSLNSGNLPRLLMPHLRALQDRIPETVVAYHAQSGVRHCLVEIESPLELRMVVPLRPYPIGRRAASDQIFVAFGSAEDRAGTSQNDPPGVDEAVELPDLALVQSRGWASSCGVYVAGSMAVSVPVQLGPKLVVLSLVGPTERIQGYGVERLAGELLVTSESISKDFRTRITPPLAI